MVFPDAEAMAVAILKAGNVCGGRVYSKLPSSSNITWPVAVLYRLGGVPADKRAIDSARIQVDVWGDDKSSARLQAELARRVLHSSESTALGSLAGYISAVTDEVGLTFLPDPETARDRYTFSVIMTTVSYST